MKTNLNKNQSNRTTTTDHPTTDRKTAADKTAHFDQWWAGLNRGERMLARQILELVEEVTETKRIEIRKDRASIRVRFLHILSLPEAGCLSAIMLPKPPARHWR